MALNENRSTSQCHSAPSSGRNRMTKSTRMVLHGGPVCSRRSAVMYPALLQRAEDHKVALTFLSPNKV